MILKKKPVKLYQMGIIDSNGVMPCRHPKHEWEHGQYTFENKRIFNLSKKIQLSYLFDKEFNAARLLYKT